MEMSGNAFLDLLRKVPREVAVNIKAGSVLVLEGVPDLSNPEGDLLWKSAQQIIEDKDKRKK